VEQHLWRKALSRTARSSGIGLLGRPIHSYRIAEGRIREQWVVRDDLGMMQQLGAVPEPPADGQTIATRAWHGNSSNG
jgi:hypothetical protein